MKLESLSALAVLAALVRAETPQIPVTAERAQSPQLADYHALCSAGQDTGTKTFDNGVTAEYTCRVKASSDVDPTEEPASSAGECAAKCGPECSSAVWQYTRNRCLLYNSVVTLSPHARGSVYLKPSGTAGDPPEGEASDCQDEREACEDELDALRGQLDGEREYNEHCERDKKDLQAEMDDLEINEKVCQREKDELDTKSKTCQREKDELDTKSKTCQREKDELDTKSKTCQREKDELNSNWKAKYEKEVNGVPLKGSYGAVLPGFYWAPNPMIIGKFPGVGTRIWQLCADACKRDTSCRASVADYSTGNCYKTRMPAGGFTTKHLQDSIGGRYGSYVK